MYAGVVEVHKAEDEDKWAVLANWVSAMSVCGNWDHSNYRVLSLNCNQYTNAALKAFRLPTLQYIFEQVGQGNTIFPDFIERGVFTPFLAEPGYLDIQSETCKGTKCTRVGNAFIKEVCAQDDICGWDPAAGFPPCEIPTV